jgi:hypothetical protein
MKRNLLRLALILEMLCFLALFVERANAFSLLGPFTPWMTTTNGFGPPNTTFADPLGDIGGPMDISNEYRLNVPIVTYGFDKSFLDYFGTNGVAAVESAIQVLNDLPPASTIVLSNYPTQSEQVNYVAQAENLYDLKTMTLALLLEQMGLAQPIRFIYVLRQWDPIFLNNRILTSQFWWENGVISNQIILRNFDPETLEPSTYVNDRLYTGYLYISLWPDQTLKYAVPLPIPVNPMVTGLTVADWLWTPSAGAFFNGLTRDDVGGLRYLYSTNNINFETLLPGISGYSVVGIIGGPTDSFVNGALRPGVDKVNFFFQPFGIYGPSPGFEGVISIFTDTFITNGNVAQQQMERFIAQPDFLFCAGDVPGAPPIWVDRTGTTNWINNAALNGNPTNGGPGVICPQARITFNKFGQFFVNNSGSSDETVENYPLSWGTFDGSTNPPTIYPVTQTGTNQFTIRMWLRMDQMRNQWRKSDWSLTNSIGTVLLFQTSTNLTDWVTLFQATNNGGVCNYENLYPSSPHRFYRVIPQ